MEGDPSVGRSHRTPAKHSLMTKIFGREVGVANSKPTIHDVRWFDLTAGDGIVDDDQEWVRNCSPGILAYHARAARKPLRVDLYENKDSVFDVLEASLTTHLPELGYVQRGECWEYGPFVQLRALFADGAKASLDGVGRGTAVFATNDPNAITQWAMSADFVAEARRLTSYFCSISTMGCNTGGVKRLPESVRRHWFGLINDQICRLPEYHDLRLAAIDRDPSQWAYLIEHPKKWDSKIVDEVNKSFMSQGLTVEQATHRAEPSRFSSIQSRLFLTEGESDG